MISVRVLSTVHRFDNGMILWYNGHIKSEGDTPWNPVLLLLFMKSFFPSGIT